MGQQPRAGLRDGDAAGGAGEQRHAELILQAGDAVGERRGAQRHAGGGHTEGLGLGGGDEAAEGLVIHGLIIRGLRTMGFGTF